MSVQTQIDRISGNVASTYDILEEAGSEMPQTRNTNNLPETVANFVTKSKQKYGKLVVFGDSVGQGEDNDNYSYVDILRESGMFSSVVKACASGACIGSYSLAAPIDAYSLVNQIERYSSDVADADVVICEYGGNDVFALLSGNIQIGSTTDSITSNTICGNIKKAISRIYELNPNVMIQWLHAFDLGNNATEHVDISGFEGLADSLLLYSAGALPVVKASGCRLLISNVWLHESLISNDGIHPNESGQQHIAKTIMQNLFSDAVLPKFKRIVTLTGDVMSNKDLVIDGEIDMLWKQVFVGVEAELHVTTPGLTSILRTVAIGDTNAPGLLFNGVNTDGTLINVLCMVGENPVITMTPLI
jgi:lysophospholipase L1-like esterase